MLSGRLKVLNSDSMEKIHQGALDVLEKNGMKIRGKFLLSVLSDTGCKVDFKEERAWFNPDLVERQMAGQKNRYKMVRSSLWYPFRAEMPDNDVAFPDEFYCDFGFATPKIYDLCSGKHRTPTVEDQKEMIKLGNGLECVKAVCSPFICRDIDPRIEIIESARMLLKHSWKPGWVGVSNPKEVKYLAELASLSTNGNRERLSSCPPIYVTAYCTTSPLKIDTRSCETLEEALKYKFPVNFASMPILGGTTPVTPAGSAVVAVAEILGCITAASLIDPDVYYYCTSISGEMDMKTTQICYASPGAILTDAALHQLFREKYGIVLNVEPAYVEAKCPGIQAAFMKTFRQMAFASSVSQPLPIGLLDNGSSFSPAQAMIDLDVNRAMFMFGRGIQVDDETLCVDLIKQMGFCENTSYLESEHTCAHFRDNIWDSMFFDRTYSGNETSSIWPENDKKLLDKADKAWRDIVSKQEDYEVAPSFSKDIDKIAEAAIKELTSS